jgi:large subunit ribosomal protein L22
MKYRASHRFADMSARKIRPFATLVRGRPVDEAQEMLQFLPNKAARLLEQVLKSAAGNALDRGVKDTEDLIVSEACIDGGPFMKRMRPKARGSANMVKRRYSHIRVVLWDGVEEPETPVQQPAGPPAQ